ncbi:MAG: AI-2E family transporter [Verrucomicrobiota bacterium]|nr:AI-2E family transporter [Verrucomicrobiota bacterium]
MNFPPPTERQTRLLWGALTGLAVAAIVALLVALVWGLGKLLAVLNPVLWPLAVAAVVACVLSPVVDWLERRNVRRVGAIALVFVFALALATGLLASVIPRVVDETRQLVVRIPDYSKRLQQHLSGLLAQPPDLLRHILSRQPQGAGTNAPVQVNQETISSATNWLAQSLPNIGRWLLDQAGRVASGFGLLLGLALVPVYTFYFLLEERGFRDRWTDYLPVRDSRFKEELVFVLSAIKQYLIAFFRGQVLVAFCDSVLYTIGFLSLGLNYAFLLGFAGMLLLMIPFLGAIILCVTALTLTLVQYGDWLHPLLVLALFGGVQTLEGLFISPKIMGDRVGLHPLAIIIALMTGTTLLGGLLGGILAIPLAAALRVILFRYLWKRTGKPAGPEV